MMISRLVCGFLLLLGMADGAPARVERPAVERFGGARPIWFEPNRGQVGGRTEWTTRAAGAWLFLTSNEVVYALAPDTSGFDPAKTRGVPNFKTTNVHMRMVGGRKVKGAGEGALGRYSNYFAGKHEDEWFTGVPHFERVRYAEVYPGIDLVYYATGRSVEYDFLVAPGADPSSIELAFDGVAGVKVDEAGDLVVSAGGKSFRQHRPRVFQGATEIDAAYRLTERGTVKVDVGEFDRLISLRVDPVLDFATYLGGPGEDGMTGIVIAPDGNPILCGATQSPASPGLDPFQQPSIVSLAPIVLKMTSDGQRVLVYSILGRNGWDVAQGLAVDAIGQIVVSGTTRSADFPVQKAFQPEIKAAWSNGFVTRLSGDARNILHSSYLGGSIGEGLPGITVDDQNSIYVSGGSESRDYPLVKPIQPVHGGSFDGVLSKIGPDGRLEFSTYWGGTGGDTLAKVKWRKDGTVIATGASIGGGFPLREPVFPGTTPRAGFPDAVLLILNAETRTVQVSTYLTDGITASATALDLDHEGRIYVGGWSQDRKFLLKNELFGEMAEGSTNGFLMGWRADAREILFSTVLPGLEVTSVALDSDGSIYAGGMAQQAFPLRESIYPFQGGGVRNGDHGILKLTPGGTEVVFMTSIGGRGNDLNAQLAAGPNRSVYFTGQTSSLDYPTKMAYQTANRGGSDSVFGRITDDRPVPVSPLRVNPTALHFTYVSGQAVPAPQVISVSNLTGSIPIHSETAWLQASPSEMSSSGNVRILPDVGRLGPGTHEGIVRVGSIQVYVTLTILLAPPILTAVEPATIAVGSANAEVTLRGSGFTNQTSILVEGVPWSLSPVQFVSSSILRFILPKSFLQGEYTFAFSVRNPGSAVSQSLTLAVGRPGPVIAAGGIVSAASFAGQVISPGEIVTVFGENFEEGMKVVFDGIAAEPFYLSLNQLSVTVPYGIAGAREVAVVVQQSAERRSVPERMVVWPARPGLFTASSSGKGQGAILNQDGSVNSAAKPAARGTVVVLYGTGGGALAGNLLELPVQVFIDGIDCEVLYAGVAPGLIPGVVQVNVRVPEFASAGEVVLRVGERESQAGVTVALDPGK